MTTVIFVLKLGSHRAEEFLSWCYMDVTWTIWDGLDESPSSERQTHVEVKRV